MIDAGTLRARIAEAAPTLWSEISRLAELWTAPAVAKLDRTAERQPFPKTLNDPIWGVIELYPWECTILDSPLLQRLRGIRQLGLAHQVYPGAQHTRLEHTLGVVEAADRMIRSLRRNAEHHERFGADLDTAVPLPSEMDIYSTRLGALLHDIGHGPFSHVTEPLIRGSLETEFVATEELLRENFEGVTKIATSETIAVLLILSEAMQRILQHPRLGAVTPAAGLAAAVASRVLGSRSCLRATYLSGVISGPIDADKLDYMARDSHHTGLPVALDVNRLISKLEVVIVTPENAPPALRDRAAAAPNHRFYEMGISLAGLGAYEQMIIGRVILYDRLYYHHKVRAAETMVRALFAVTAEELARPLALKELFNGVSDDTLIAILGGDLQSGSVPSGQGRAQSISAGLLNRCIYYRAFAFAARFIAGLDGLPEKDQKDTKALLWNSVLSFFLTPGASAQLAKAIYECSLNVSSVVPFLRAISDGFSREHILVDLPVNKAVVRGGDILTRTEGGHVATPNLFFDPERWSQAYEHQKHGGFVFCPKEYISLVAFATSIVFFEKFHIIMDASALTVCKTVGLVQRDWIEQVAEAGLCSQECRAALTEVHPVLLQIRPDEIRLPDSWRSFDPAVANRMSEAFEQAIVGGVPASIHKAVINAIDHLSSFVQMAEQGGIFVGLSDLRESDLQSRLRDHLRSRGVEVQEGTELGGGETDLILPGRLIVENKVRSTPTADPIGVGTNYPWQARRYAISVGTRISFVVVAYKTADERSLLPQAHRMVVVTPEGAPEGHAQVKVVIPWGHSVPSSAKAPKL